MKIVQRIQEFNENRPKGSVDMEQTQNSRVNHLTLTCDLDLESRLLGYVLFTLYY